MLFIPGICHSNRKLMQLLNPKFLRILNGIKHTKPTPITSPTTAVRNS